MQSEVQFVLWKLMRWPTLVVMVCTLQLASNSGKCNVNPSLLHVIEPGTIL